MADARTKANEAEAGDDTPLLEWVAGAIGAALFATALVLTLHPATRPRQPPDVTARVEAVSRVAGGWLVAFKAQNAGGETAENVTVTATLEDGGEAVETRRAEIGFLPTHATRTAAIVFARDPQGLEIVLHPEGFELP